MTTTANLIDPEALSDQFLANAEIDLRQILSNILDSDTSLEEPMVSARSVQQLLASVQIMMVCMHGQDSETGAFAIHEERWNKLLAFVDDATRQLAIANLKFIYGNEDEE